MALSSFVEPRLKDPSALCQFVPLIIFPYFMYSKLSFKWDSARHGLLRKPFKTWKLFVRNNQRKRAIEQQ
jgi:hypothetical protein